MIGIKQDDNPIMEPSVSIAPFSPQEPNGFMIPKNKEAEKQSMNWYKQNKILWEMIPKRKAPKE